MEAIFIRLLNMSIMAGWLILAIVLLRLVFRRAPKAILCILWALVGIRLVCPFSIESMLSLIPSAETISPDILYSETPSIHSGLTVLNSAVNPTISEALASEAEASVNPVQVATHIAAVVWIVGMAVMLLYSIISYVRLRRRVNTAVLLRDNIWQSEAASSPFVLGFFRPRMYVPFHIDNKSMTHVVAHEKAHIRRRDHWIKPIGFLLLTAYWFNPFIWLAYVLLCRDIELACDERVIKRMDAADKKAYSQALLTCSVNRRSIAACPLAFGEVGVKQRVKSVLNYKKPAFWIVIAALISCAAVAVCFLTNPQEPESSFPLESQPADYVFRSVVYTNPLSSYYAYNGTGCRYLLSSDSFTIVDEATGEVREFFTDLNWNWQRITDEEWSELFSVGLGVPDISVYEAKRMLTLSDTYSLLNMDDELWLMQTNGGSTVWQIYALTPEGSNTLTLQDVLSLSMRGDTLTWELLRPYAYEDVGSGRYIYVFPISESWQLYVNSAAGFSSGGTIDEPVLLGYLPDNESVDIRGGDSAAFIAEKQSVEKNTPIVFSGYSLCTAIPSDSDDEIETITFDPAHCERYAVPFSVYMNGARLKGAQYSIRDADTGEALDFIRPSGLASQTYILRNALSGHRYEITFQVTNGDVVESYVFIIYVNN